MNAVLIVVALVLLAVLIQIGKKRRAALEQLYGKVAPQVATDRPFALTWFGPGSTLVVAGIALRDPCVYASRGIRRATDPGEIRLEDAVARGRGALAELPYWPWYSDADPAQRHAYLTWLASGRDALPPLEGCIFLWYFGLERRLLVDRTDRELVLAKVLELLALDAPRRGTKEGRSLRRYANGLIWLCVAREPDAIDRALLDRVITATDEFDDDSLAVALAWHARTARAIDEVLAMQVAEVHPRAVRGTVRKRVGARFDELFARRYRERFHDGLIPGPGKRIRSVAYKPANAALREVSASFADPLAKHEQFDPLVEIWNSCVEDLRKLGRVATDSDSLTLEAWEALPPEMREETEHPAAPAIRALCGQEETILDGIQSIAIRDLAATITLEPRARLTATQSRRLAVAIEAAGFCVEPDCRISGKSYGWDESVAIYIDPDAAGTRCDPARFQAAATMLRLGLEVATSDGVCNEEELRQLSQEIEAAFQLSDTERRRLDALRAMLVRAGSDTRAVAKRLEATLPREARESLGKLLVAIAASSRDIDRKETQALRKCYRALGLPPESLEAAIAELTPRVDEGLVSLRQPGSGGDEDSGEAIPPPPESGVRLDPHAVHRILAETREVARLLADAMAVEDEPAGAEETILESPRTRTEGAPMAQARAPEPAVAVLGSVPPERYRGFHAELVTQKSWPRPAAEALAKKHGLMLSGAIEALNEWSLDATGVPLIDETDATLELA